MNKKRTRKKEGHLKSKIITILQLILSLLFIIVMINNGLIPTKYIVSSGIILLVMFALTFGLQFAKYKLNILGAFISILMSIGAIVGIIGLLYIGDFMKEIGGAEYKTDNMVVVVRVEDAAEILEDTVNYRFGIQTSQDQENNKLMLKDMKDKLNREFKTVEYSTVLEEGTALLEGKIDAAIYNEAFTGLLDEMNEGYSDKVRVLYRYGIETKVDIPEEIEEATSVEDPFNVYISGIDVSGSITTTSRSDVNIIMTVNPNTKKILLTTTPRDYYVQIPEVSGEAKDKLTHAGIYGVDASMRTLGQLYGIDIKYYARVNFTSLITIVDALGGVDVNSEYEFEAGGYGFKKGINHLNGDAALAFSRERYSFSAGDNQRGKNQEAVLTAILNKAMSLTILKNANEIIAKVGTSVETNMTDEEMAKFINMQLSDNARWSIESVAASGSGDMLPCYSSGSQPLYVMHPNLAVVEGISNKMQEILGE